ncbi:valine--tRNA ligase [Sarracenia purpurea var. burkii]
MREETEEEYIVTGTAEEAFDKARKKYGSVGIYHDADVLDTWFSSALWPFSTLRCPDVSAEDFRLFYPTTVLETAFVPLLDTVLNSLLLVFLNAACSFSEVMI